MSRLAKWKFEKTKVKLVFRLQFHATHIPQTGWDKLFISFIPADSGKATAKTTKANVRNGTCKWADPIYESTRLLQDAKTKCIDEKIYKFVVGMGTSRSSILGETNINLADYADALKPSGVALPLHGCDSGTILHVNVQLLTSKTGFREFEQQRELRERGFQTTTDQNSHDESGGGKVSSSERTVNNQIDRVNSRVRFKPESREHPLLEEEVGLNAEYADSAIGCDGSSNTSESIYAEKHDSSSTHEIESLKSTVSGNVGGHSLSQSPRPGKGDLPDHRLMAQGNNDWVHGWGSDYSIDNDLGIAYEENSRLPGSLEVAESSLIELKFEVNSLQSHADEISTLTQKFAHQLAAEIASGEELTKEVSLLKSECKELKSDLEGLKGYKLTPLSSSTESNDTDQGQLLQNVQLGWFKGLLVMEDKVRELQNKACLGFHEREFEFLNPDLEELLSVMQDLKQGTGQAVSTLSIVPVEKENLKDIREMNGHQTQQFVSGGGFDLDLYQPEDMLHSLSIPGLISHQPDSVDATNVMNGNFFELLRELDESKSERESLARKMDQMECYYEALIQELEENQKRMLEELQNLRHEHSTCLYTMSSTKVQMETMRQEMDGQIFRYAEDRRDLDVLNKELERRAVTSEAALKRARLNYSIAVDQLQKDLELLSFQVVSMFETNENLIRETFPEASQPSLHGYPDTVLNPNLDTVTSDAFKPLRGKNENAEVKKQLIGGDMILEDLKRSLYLQEELYKKVEEELCEMHLANIKLDVFSRSLRETLVEATADSRRMKEKMDELTQELKFSTESKELMMRRLQNAMEDVQTLNEYKASCLAKCNDMALHSQILEAKLGSVSSENCLLTQKITEMETMVIELGNYKSIYEACVVQRTELTSSLKQESLENGSLRNEISSLQGRLKTVKNECGEMAYLKENLQNIVNFLQEKLGNLLEIYNKQFRGLSLWSKPLNEDMDLEDLMSVVSQLEEFQHNACHKIFQLTEDKKDLQTERDVALLSSCTANSEILAMKQKCEHDVQNMGNKLDVTNALVQKLQLNLEGFADRLELSSKTEEKFSHLNEELVSDLASLEVELQDLTLKNKDIAQEILGLETVSEELGKSRLAISEYAQKNQDLMTSLQEKTDESVKLASELISVKECLTCLRNELHDERGFRDKLEGTVTELTSQLNEKNDQLLHLDLQKANLVHFKQLASHLEEEKSRLNHLVMQSQECLKIAHKDSSSVIHLEAELFEMHKLLIAADVNFVFLRALYENRIEELFQLLHSSDREVGETHKIHLDVETTLSGCLAREAHYKEENAKLMMSLESLRSELEASVAHNSVVMNSISQVTTEFEQHKNTVTVAEISHLKDKNQHALEVQQLKLMLASSEEEIANLMFSNEELEIEVVLLKAKLDEQIILLEGYNDELLLLQNRCNELTQKLSEQVMKTEEFKNLSLHFKELKDKAEAECLQARERREPEGNSFAVQDSLRIAFIKEQYETKLQELRHQLSISKKHGEEMLWKLQDTIDEVENRKKSEASHFKKIEELSMRILELETDIQTVRSDKREKVNTCERIQAELECSLISLECCKEEKDKLEASLQECNEEKAKIAVELTSMKDQLGSSANPTNSQDDGSRKPRLLSLEPIAGSHERISMEMVPRHGTIENPLDHDSTVNCEEAENSCSVPVDEGGHLSALMNVQSMQDALVSRGVHETPRSSLVDERNLLHNESKHLALINDHFKTQSLKSSMDHLHNELEKMKNENSLLQQDVHQFDPKFYGLQRELMQLHKANEELRSIFPSYNELPANGNALERVLGLEVELAESLQSKNKSSIQFQSSFLKQHSDEEAVFKSFRDINELIKDMLEVKSRYTGVETELKEMHDRYSQLSLQFAEVEGERQKLMMTLKNLRASKKHLLLNRSSSATIGETCS